MPPEPATKARTMQDDHNKAGECWAKECFSVIHLTPWFEPPGQANAWVAVDQNMS